MINNIKITNSKSETLLLELRSPEKSGFFIKGIDGLGPTRSYINFTEPAGNNGMIYNSARARYRNILIDLGILNGYGYDVETQRQSTYKLFPVKQQVLVEVSTDNRDLFTTGFIESNEPDIFSKEENTRISILCESSYWSDKAIIETVFTGNQSMFEFPFENASLTESLIEFSLLLVDTVANVYYTGDVNTGFEIFMSFDGAVTGLSIHNVTTNQSMSIDSTKVATITGSNFTAGDTLHISTVIGSKYITLTRSGVDYNILNALDTSYSWLELQEGDNGIAYYATAGLDNINLLVKHRPIYQGV